MAKIGNPTTTLWKYCRKYTDKDQFVIMLHRNVFKPHLTIEHKVAQVFYACSRLNVEEGTYDSFHQEVHVNEKWWFLMECNYKFYLTVGETAPKNSITSKNNITKVMMLSAIARPQFNDQGICIFDGKIGIWPFVDRKTAKRSLKNRPKGAQYLVPKETINQDVYHNLLM